MEEELTFRRTPPLYDPTIPIHSSRKKASISFRPSPGVSRSAFVSMNYRGAENIAEAAGDYLSYMTREGTGRDGKGASLFGRDENHISLQEYKERINNNTFNYEDRQGYTISDEPRFWRVILSPKLDGYAGPVDMSEYVRGVMKSASEATGYDLNWVAAAHYNTDHEHAHIMIHGIDLKGREVQFDPDFIKHGFRQIARSRATRMFGVRTRDELQQSLGRQVAQNRFTEIDRAILHRSHENTIDASNHFQVERLRYLENLSLARRRTASSVWDLDAGWVKKLRSMGDDSDRNARMDRVASGPDKPRIFWEPKLGKVSGIIRDREYENEVNGKKYGIVESSDAVYYLVDRWEKMLGNKRVGEAVTLGASTKSSTSGDGGHIPDDTSRQRPSDRGRQRNGRQRS